MSHPSTQPRALVRNASDPKQVQRARDRVTLAQEQDDADLRAIMATDAGQRMLWRFLSQCELFLDQTKMDAGVYRHLGKRAVGLWLIGELTRVDEEGWLAMQRAAMQRAKTIDEPSPRTESPNEDDDGT